ENRDVTLSLWILGVVAHPAEGLIIKRRIRSKDMSSRAKRYAYESSGSGNSSTSSECFCHCGLRAPLQVSNSVANPGREYYSCPARRFQYFSWAGPAIHGTTRLGGQIYERNPEEHKVDSNTNLHLHERVVKIEANCIRLKLLAFKVDQI
ncbi:hypothetical protein PIB30_078825, partial [Stylosanthes scabra]|nr:hypothetical protein [Stylosanthes scabra]